MTVRQATADDLPQLLAIGERFWSISPWAAMGLERDDIAICEYLERAIEGGGCFLSDSGGVIFGFAAPLWASPSNLIAIEMAWFGRGEGRALREAFEDWARSIGCVAVQMSTLGDGSDDETGRKLSTAGYAKNGQMWWRSL